MGEVFHFNSGADGAADLPPRIDVSLAAAQAIPQRGGEIAGGAEGHIFSGVQRDIGEQFGSVQDPQSFDAAGEGKENRQMMVFWVPNLILTSKCTAIRAG